MERQVSSPHKAAEQALCPRYIPPNGSSPGMPWMTCGEVTGVGEEKGGKWQLLAIPSMPLRSGLATIPHPHTAVAVTHSCPQNKPITGFFNCFHHGRLRPQGESLPSSSFSGTSLQSSSSSVTKIPFLDVIPRAVQI